MSESPFRTNVLLVAFPTSDEMSDGYAVVENPRIIEIEGVKFLEGNHANDCAEYIRGKRVLFPLSNLSCITEFETTEQVWKELTDDKEAE